MVKAIASTKVVFEDEFCPGTVIYDEDSGKIVDIVIGKVLTNDEIRLRGWLITNYEIVSPNILMPGLVDSHVHLNEPGRTEWEGFETGTKAAISGGVTTVIDMPLNAIPPTTTIENLQIKLKAAEGQLWCDVGFWGGMIPGNLNDLKPLIDAGVRGFKGFLIDSGVDEFPAIDKRYIMEALELLQGEPTMIMFHAELQTILPGDEHSIVHPNEICDEEHNNSLSLSRVLSPVEPRFGPASDIVHPHHVPSADDIVSPLKAAEIETHDSSLSKVDPRQYESFLLSRPDHFEVNAIALIVACLRRSVLSYGLEKSPLVHIVHLASKDALPILARAKKESLPITAETCFHYLTLAAEKIPESKTFYKCCPPIREEKNRRELWKALRNGLLTSVVSDHSPCTPELKNLAKGDFFSAWGGIASVGLGLPLLFTEGASVRDIVTWCCENTSKQVGLDHTKGFLKKGYDADFVVFDPHTYQLVSNEKVYFKNKLTAYDGKKLRGVVKTTYLRGKIAFDLGDKSCINCPLGRTILERRKPIFPTNY